MKSNVYRYLIAVPKGLAQVSKRFRVHLHMRNFKSAVAFSLGTGNLFKNPKFVIIILKNHLTQYNHNYYTEIFRGPSILSIYVRRRCCKLKFYISRRARIIKRYCKRW